MIKSLNIASSSSSQDGVVYDSASWTGYTCLVGQFVSVNGFATKNIALIDTATGLVDSTSDLALALKNLGNTFSAGVTRVIYETSNSHPCLIFLSYALTQNRCYVFFLETLSGYDLLYSTPLAISNDAPAENQNSSTYKDMKVCSAQRALIVYGSFYIGNPSISLNPHNGCVALSLDAMHNNFGIANACVYANFGGATAFNNFDTRYGGVSIDQSNSVLYIYNNQTYKLEKYTISTSALTYVSTFPIQKEGVDTITTTAKAVGGVGGGIMEHYSDKLYIATYYNPGMRIFIYDTLSSTWTYDHFMIFRNQFNGGIGTGGMKTINSKLYLWGSFTNCFYPQAGYGSPIPPSLSYLGIQNSTKWKNFNKRSGLVVFDISATPTILGEDLGLSLGAPSQTYLPPPTWFVTEQSVYITHAIIDDSNVYLFRIRQKRQYGVYGPVANHTGTPTVKMAIWKRGVEYDESPIKVTLDGYDAQFFEPNLLY